MYITILIIQYPIYLLRWKMIDNIIIVSEIRMRAFIVFMFFFLYSLKSIADEPNLIVIGRDLYFIVHYFYF